MARKDFKLPENCLLKVVSVNGHGDLTAEAAESGVLPRRTVVMVAENRRIKPALAEGDVFLARLSRKRDAVWAKPLMRVESEGGHRDKVYGVIARKGDRYYLKLPERKNYAEYLLDDIRGVAEGDFVSAVLAGERRFKQVKIVKNFGPFNMSKAISYSLFEQAGVPSYFEDDIEKEAERPAPFDKAGREDLTAVPLVTIDGDDSKDFDDAVYAEKTETGFKLIVAIADVAWYVREGSGLDREAYRRGNSVYLPNVVLPMLPPRLSNDLCSLNPREERAALACLMEIDRDGNLLSYDFKRAVIKSAARLTYGEVQQAFEGILNENTRPVFKKTIQALYEAYFALGKARERRGALNIESDEIKVKVSKDGVVESIKKAELFTSNKVIEEFMIAANVAAALALKNKKLPVMYRVHDRPAPEKLKDAQPLLKSFKLSLPDYAALKPEHFNRILETGEREGLGLMTNSLVLRLQAQAKYSPQNIGHFGLGLKDYVHFTSPIRRYADLLIHRALIALYDMPGGGGLTASGGAAFEETAEHLCMTERRAVSLERDITAKFLAVYLEPLAGVDFEVRISGMTQAGLFVTIEDMGAEGFIPIRTLPDDDYVLKEGSWAMKGHFSRRTFRFGAKIKARLVEATPVNGGLIFKYVDEDEGVDYYDGATCHTDSRESVLRRKAKNGSAAKKKPAKAERRKKLKENNKRKKRVKA